MPKIYTLETLEIGHSYSLTEVCQRVNLESDFVIQCVDYGITEVSGGGAGEEWRFPAVELIRLKKAFRLQRDLGIDFTGLAVVMDLLDDIERLRANVDLLNKRLRDWESENGG